MKLRAKANGNVVDLPDGEAKALLATGIYEAADAEAEGQAGDDSGTKGKRKYRRRDLRAEE